MVEENCYVNFEQYNGGYDFVLSFFDYYDDFTMKIILKDKKFAESSFIEGECFNFVLHDDIVFLIDRRNGECRKCQLEPMNDGDEIFKSIDLSDFETLDLIF